MTLCFHRPSEASIHFPNCHIRKFLQTRSSLCHSSHQAAPKPRPGWRGILFFYHVGSRKSKIKEVRAGEALTENASLWSFCSVPSLNGEKSVWQLTDPHSLTSTRNTSKYVVKKTPKPLWPQLKNQI